MRGLIHRYRERKRLLAAATALALILGGCGGTGSSAKTQHSLVPPAEFAAVVAEPGTVTINVLGPGVESIRGTDLAIRYDELEARSAELPSTSTQLAVYCAHGNASAAAVPVLEGLGYTKIVELEGGMAAWAAAGRKLLEPAPSS